MVFGSEKKICPFGPLKMGQAQPCREEKCAIWNDGECAILSIAKRE